MKKKRVLTAICVCLLMGIALIATIAYGTGSGSSGINDIDIDQVINQTDSVLDPSLRKSSDGSWLGIDNVNNLSVQVKNSENSDDSVYVRTIFAFEAGMLSVAEFHDLLCININSTDWSWQDNENWTPIDINGEDYFMVTATYKGSVVPGSVTSSSLKGIGMDWNADYNRLHAAGFGDGLTIKTYSQAVQCDGFSNDPVEVFEDTYGDVTAEKHPWNVVYVSTWDELMQALKDGKNVVLIDDIIGDFGTLTIN